MLNLVKQFEQKQIKSLKERSFDFCPGDTLIVGTKIIDGQNERIQYFEGLCIAIRKKGLMSNFVLIKMCGDIMIERNFILHSPLISSIKIVKRGAVRRSKIYYIKSLRGKKARLKERK